MDWRSIRFDWNRARAFLVTAEEGSLSAAARALGMAQPTLSRQVAALEHELRVTLFERVSRGLELTHSGRELLEHARSMGDAARRVARSASGEASPLHGTIAISASEVVAVFVLPPIVAYLRQEHPGVEVRLVSANADIAVASEAPSDASQLSQRVRDLRSRYYAAPSYLEQQPASSPRPTLLAENQLVAWELVKRGLGIGAMLEEVGDAEPLVRRAPPDDVMTKPCFLVARPEAHRSRRLHTVFDFLVAELA